MKQDDALSDLSNILGELKVMAIDMGSEIDGSVLFSHGSYLIRPPLPKKTSRLRMMYIVFDVRIDFPPLFRHVKALDSVDDDVAVLNQRVQYANRRGQQLLRR